MVVFLELSLSHDGVSCVLSSSGGVAARQLSTTTEVSSLGHQLRDVTTRRQESPSRPMGARAGVCRPMGGGPP